MSDEKLRTMAHALSTECRADETPVIKEMTTKMLSGTRDNDESYIKKKKFRCHQHHDLLLKKPFYRRPMFIGY